MNQRPQDDPLAEGLIRVDRAASWLGISRAGVYRLLNEGELRSIRIGSARLIPREELRRFTERKIEQLEAANG